MTSLRSIHIVLISASIALAVMVALWGVAMYATDNGTWGHLAFGLGSLATGVGLAVYLMAFMRRTRQIGMR